MANAFILILPFAVYASIMYFIVFPIVGITPVRVKK